VPGEVLVQRVEAVAVRPVLGGQPDLSPKAWPRYVWIADDLPSTATNKILKRELVSYGTTPPGGLLWKREGQRYGSVSSRSDTSAARNSS